MRHCEAVCIASPERRGVAGACAGDGGVRCGNPHPRPRVILSGGEAGVEGSRPRRKDGQERMGDRQSARCKMRVPVIPNRREACPHASGGMRGEGCLPAVWESVL